MEIERRARQLFAIGDDAVKSACTAQVRIEHPTVGTVFNSLSAISMCGALRTIVRGKWRVLSDTNAARRADVE